MVLEKKELEIQTAKNSMGTFCENNNFITLASFENVIFTSFEGFLLFLKCGPRQGGLTELDTPC